MSKVKVGKDIITCRESYDDGHKWVSVKTTGRNLSLNDYRVVESSPISPLRFKSEYQSLRSSWGKDISYELGDNNIASTAKLCKNSKDIIKLFEDVLYYGFSTEKLRPELLNQYVLSEKYDPGYNPFREAGVLNVIEDRDVEELANVAGINIKIAVKILKEHGIKKGEELVKIKGNYLEFCPETVSLWGKLSFQDEKELFRRIFEKKRSTGKRLNFSYAEVRKASLLAKL